MKLYIYISLFLLIFIFIKFPISIKIEFANKEFKVYIYKFLMFSNVSKADISKREQKKIKKDAKRTVKKTIKRRKLFVTILLKKLMKIKYKINLRFFLNFDFGLEDSALTALLYGYSNIVASSTYIVLTKFFKVKKFNVNINPKFNKSTMVINLKCIFNANIVNIITILIVTLKSFRKVKKIKY